MTYLRVCVCDVYRHPPAVFLGAASPQHALVSDQCDVAGCGPLPGLFVSSARLRPLSPVHEP